MTAKMQHVEELTIEGAVVRAELVFMLQIDNMDMAPTLNAYKGQQTWTRMANAQKLDDLILVTSQHWPGARLRFETVAKIHKVKGVPKVRKTRVGGVRRIVRLTRHTSREPDELSVDVLGGKLPVDRLVLAGILIDDRRAWLARLARWVPARPGQARVVVEVFDFL